MLRSRSGWTCPKQIIYWVGTQIKLTQHAFTLKFEREWIVPWSSVSCNGLDQLWVWIRFVGNLTNQKQVEQPLGKQEWSEKLPKFDSSCLVHYSSTKSWQTKIRQQLPTSTMAQQSHHRHNLPQIFCGQWWQSSSPIWARVTPQHLNWQRQARRPPFVGCLLIWHVWHKVAIWCRKNSVRSSHIGTQLSCWTLSLVEQISITESCQAPYDLEGGKFHWPRPLRRSIRFQQMRDHCWQGLPRWLPLSPFLGTKYGGKNGRPS